MENLYVLWLVPSANTSKPLQKIINDLSKKYHSPVFEPHITLLGNISCDLETMIQRTKILVSKLKPFSISLGEISFGTTYFKSVFIKVKINEALMNVNLIAKEIFKVENKNFMPHLSLVYSNNTVDERKNIISKITLSKDINFKIEKIIVLPYSDNPNEFTHIVEFQLE